MNAAEKDEKMLAFKNKEFDVLVSTTVIEVGVDVSNATLMVIFDSERFGLSQLHQLRGRVGRNDLQSYCLLVTNSDAKRLEIMEETNDGFEISEADLELRGPGDLFGIRQSGVMVFKQADLVADQKLYEIVRSDVEYIYENKILSSNYVKYLEERLVSLG
jgi:ATP-dependent DNA helicase RecG